MKVIEQLAGSMQRRDEQPNIELAIRLSERKQPRAVADLVALLSCGTTRQQGDAVKVLYELAARKPKNLTPHIDALVLALSSANSRVGWGVLSALDNLTETHPAIIFDNLKAVLQAAAKPSVIGKDRSVSILCQLCALGFDGIAPLLLERVRLGAVNQFVTYAEKAAPVLPADARVDLEKILKKRLKTLTQPPKRKRVELLLRRLSAA